ncbi:MAG: glucuronate isomerase [Clostridia bacterium]|nr:glucuronate isomerase [Clostridia bacterium]
MNERFLLKNPAAERLFDAVKSLPVIDFHNHLSPSDLARDRSYENLFEILLECDPYKHRLMRICGVPEEYITGSAAPKEKFLRFCKIFPTLAGNPVYDWTRMELSFLFGMDALPSEKTALCIWDETAEKLRSPEYSAKGILSRFRVEFQSPVASLTDDLSVYGSASVAPSLRGDNLLCPDEALCAALREKTGIAVTDRASYLRAVSFLLDRFDAAGCAFADHSLDAGFFDSPKEEAVENLRLLAAEYKKRGWTMLLHLGAKRDTSPRLRALAGPAGGFAAGDRVSTAAVADLIGSMEKKDGLPDTVLFPLHQGDQTPLAVLQGSFSEDGVSSKVQLGPAWWWCDHAQGIENTLSAIASCGVLSRFIGMTTDSRSILSFVRHDYFRRILCSFLERKNREEEWELSEEALVEIASRISYYNAKEKLTKRGMKK